MFYYEDPDDVLIVKCQKCGKTFRTDDETIFYCEECINKKRQQKTS
jgi:hypothetical protein